MKSRRTRRSAPFAVAFRRQAKALLRRSRTAQLLVGFLLASLLPVFLPADWFQARSWKGYYTVFLPLEAASGSELPERLRSFGPAPVVSRHTARASFNTFAGMTSVPVAELHRRLDPADPRLDPYLQKVDAYFRSPAGELAYVRTQRGPLLSGLGRLGRGRKVLELDPVAVLLRLLAAAGAALLVLLPARVPQVPRWLLGLGLLPWGLSVPTGDLRDLLAFLLLFPLWVRAMVWAAARQPAARRSAGSKRRPGSRRTGGTARRGRRTRKKSRLPAFWPAGLEPREAVVRAGLFLLGAAVLFLAAPGVRHLPGVLFALAADLCLLAMLPAARRWERSRRAHPLFRALPILGTLKAKASRRPRRPTVPGLVVPAALALLALASVAALTLEARRRDLDAPRLERSGGRDLSWPDLAALPLSPAAEDLPHLADFLAHRAYQQTLAFQRPYRFPASGERVYISGYAATPDGYVRSRRVARRFEESWLSRTLAEAPPGSVERLLVDQGRAAAVERVGEPLLLRELAAWQRAAALALFLLACLTAAAWSDTRAFAL